MRDKPISTKKNIPYLNRPSQTPGGTCPMPGDATAGSSAMAERPREASCVFSQVLA